MKYIVNIKNNQTIGIGNQLSSNGDIVDLTKEQIESRGIKGMIQSGILVTENRTIRRAYGPGDMPEEVIVVSKLGIGDLVFEEPGFRLLLKAGVKKVHLFARPDGIKLFHDYAGITVYPLDAQATITKIASAGVPVLTIDETTHKKTGIENRVEAFTSYMLSSFNLEIPSPCPQPYLPVGSEQMDWAEIFVDQREGQEVVLLHIESSRDYKNIPREQAIRMIDFLLDKGKKVLLYANNYKGLPRHANLKELRGVSIERFMAICKLVDMTIAMDSAPSWIAAAVGCEVLAVFGPTSPLRYALRKSNLSVLQWNPRCGRQPCETGCPHNKCIKEIPDDVLLNALVSPVRLAKWTDQIEQIKGNQTHYPYVASKTPMLPSPRLKLMALIPHLFLGGGETQMEYLLDRLPDYDITVVIVDTIDDVMYPIWADKYDIIHLGGSDKPSILRNLIKDISPDVILYHGSTILNATLIGLKCKPVVIQIAHSACTTYSEPTMHSMSEYNDHVITVAKWLENKFSPLLPNRFTTVLNGVPSEQAKKTRQSKEIRLGMLTRLAGGKGLGELLDAMYSLPENVKLSIGGWGEEEKRLRKRSEALGDRMEFLGQVLDRNTFFDNIDCAILPSEAEGNSMFLLEAAMASKPIITTNVGAVPELFEHDRSALVIDGTAPAIKRAVMRLNNEAGLSERLAAAAYKIVSNKASASIMACGYRDVITSETNYRQSPRTILCFRDGGRGDILMTIPTMRYLYRRFPGVKITYLLPSKLAPVIDGLGIVDEIIVQDEITNSDFLTLSHQYDVAFHFRHDEVWDTGQHIIDFYLQMAGCQELGDRDISVSVDNVELPVEYDAPYVCLHTRSAYRCKNWGTDSQWKRVIEHLSAKYTVIQIGGDDQVDLGVIPAYKERLSPLQTMRLLKDAEFLIGVDSYPIHAAKAVECPTIAIYGGASSPYMCGYDDNINIVSHMDCACSGSKGMGLICPTQYACMNYIKVADVISAIDNLITH